MSCTICHFGVHCSGYSKVIFFSMICSIYVLIQSTFSCILQKSSPLWNPKIIVESFGANHAENKVQNVCCEKHPSGILLKLSYPIFITWCDSLNFDRVSCIYFLYLSRTTCSEWSLCWDIPGMMNDHAVASLWSCNSRWSNKVLSYPPDQMTMRLILP